MTVTTAAEPLLFTPLKIANGKIELSHRVVLAPMTRNRNPPLNAESTPEKPNRIWYPDDVVTEYYDQRATLGGLFITEGISPSLQVRCFRVSEPRTLKYYPTSETSQKLKADLNIRAEVCPEHQDSSYPNMLRAGKSRASCPRKGRLHLCPTMASRTDDNISYDRAPGCLALWVALG
jgi:hypothetical protein